MKAINWRYLLPLALFIALAYYMLLGMYSDMLYTAQERNTFFTTSMFFDQTVRQPFGLMTWLGGYLTQYFYHPAVGVSILMLVWALIYGISVKAFRPVANGAGWLILPLGCLLASITDVGYWVYTLNIPGYWFSQSIGYLCMMLMLWGAQVTSSRFRMVWYVVALMLYPLMGWMSILFAMCLGVGQLCKTADGSSWMQNRWLNLVLMALVWLAPYVWRALLYSHMNMRSIWLTGFPFFESSTTDTMRPTIPFIFLIGITLWLSAFAYRQDSVIDGKWGKRLKLNAITISVLAILLCVGGVWKTQFADYNYQAEMRMNRMAMEDDWQGIIDEAARTNTPSRAMVLLRNIALLNTNQLGSRAFLMNGSGEDICNIDSMNLNVMQIASPMVYYNFGKINYALRWCMEFAVSYGYCPYYAKMMARVAQATGEEKLYKRYMHLLSNTTFHAEWRPKPVTEVVRNLQKTFLNVLDSDNNNMERYLIENFSLALGSDSKYVKELNLFYSMLFRDPKSFWQAFHAYASMTNGQNLPMHYQEAYLEFNAAYPAKLPYVVQIDPDVMSRFESFKGCLQNAAQYCNNDKKQMADMLRDQWLCTFWYYLYFGRMAY